MGKSVIKGQSGSSVNGSQPNHLNVADGSNVPAWIHVDMRKHLPPSIEPTGMHSVFPTAPPHERPATFQSSVFNQPQASMQPQMVSPWGPPPNYAMPHSSFIPQPSGSYPTANDPSAKKRRRRVRKRPRDVPTYSSSSSSSSAGHRHRRCKRKHIDSIHGSASLGSAARMRGRGGGASTRSESSNYDARVNEAAYTGPQFVPALMASSSDWGAVPTTELKWNRKGMASHDLFPDWKVASHHTQKVIRRTKGCC
eukprot:GHVH01007659.1.p1 GENE.GHVH01007659.1~~GHVH01007659.1.p1  ORF type:complete len:253 (+),score=22.05 GHVH01007659.1:175-933(+)